MGSGLSAFFEFTELTEKFIECLTSNASKNLKELRLIDMLHLVRSLPVFLQKLGEGCPKIRIIGTTVNQDLQRASLEHPDEDAYSSSHFGDQLEASTPTTCWGYLRLLKMVCEDPRYTLNPLDNEGVYELNPSHRFSYKDTESSTSPSVEVFRSLKQHLSWSPTFDWNDQMHEHPEGRPHFKLIKMRDEMLKKHTRLCRELFQDLKEAHIPVKLLLNTTRRYGAETLDHGSFFLRPWKAGRSEAKKLYEKEQAIVLALPKHSSKMNPIDEQAGPWQWYFDTVGDLVDHFTVNWGHKFLREPINQKDERALPYHPALFDTRPREERTAEERTMIQPLWTELAQTFPNIVRLQMHVPAEVYIGDDEMMKLLPGTGWTLRRGQDVVIPDLRIQKGFTPQAPVTFLDRVFARDAVTACVTSVQELTI